MNAKAEHKTTTRRLILPALAVLLTLTAPALPAVAATTAQPTPATTTAPDASADAGSASATWTRLMNQKVIVDAQAVALTVQLPALRAAITTRKADLVKAQQTQTAATGTVTAATAAEQNVRTKLATAQTAATVASSAAVAAAKRKPVVAATVLTTRRNRTAANATVRALTTSVSQAGTALTAAQHALTAATALVTTSTTAVQTATDAVTNAQQTIAARPAQDAALLAQAKAIGPDVVTESRAGFTMTQTTAVYGITVNKIIAAPFKQLIDDAAKAGIKFSGGGFRTKERQMQLRTVNGCPDIWTAPASSCRVPTAIPGRSLHELGLAIDLSVNGKTITDRNGAPFKWLAAHAAQYGLSNLPAEAWHWSITGN